MTRDEQIKELFLRPSISQIITNATSNTYYQEELKSILFEALCKLSEERLNKEYENGIEKYCGQIIKNQFFSDNSRFHNHIRKPEKRVSSLDGLNDDIPETDDNKEELLNLAQTEFNKLNWFDKVDKKTISQIVEETGINKHYVTEVLKRIKKTLQTNIKKNL